MRALEAPFPGSKPCLSPSQRHVSAFHCSLPSCEFVCRRQLCPSLLQQTAIRRQRISSHPHPPSAPVRSEAKFITVVSPVTFWTAGWLLPPRLSRHTLPTARGSCAPGSSHHHGPTLALWTSAPSSDTSTQTTHKNSLKLHSWLLSPGWPSFSVQPQEPARTPAHAVCPVLHPTQL